MHKIGHGGTHFTSWAQELRSTTTSTSVSSLGYSASAKHLVVAAGSAVLVVSASTLATVVELDHGALVHGVTFAGSESVVASVGGDGAARVWDCSAATQSHAFEGAGSAACSVAFGIAAGQPLLAVGYADGTAGLRGWTGECLVTLPAHSGPVLGLDLSRDCKLLATASADGGARVWRVPDGACTAVLHAGAKAGQLNRVRFGSVRTSSMVVVATASGEALAFQLPSGSGAPAELRPALSFKGHTGPCRDLAIGENGEVLATASQDRAIRLWKLRSGEHARALPGGGEVVALAFSSRGAANLATATAKGTVKVFGIVPRGGDAGMFARGR